MNHIISHIAQTMKSKRPLAPDEDIVSTVQAEEIVLAKNKNARTKRSKKTKKSVRRITPPTKFSYQHIQDLAFGYLQEVIEWVADKTNAIVYLPKAWDICKETGIDRHDAFDILEIIKGYVQDLLLCWMQWDWVWVDGIFSDEDGIIFKNTRISRESH